MWQVSFRVQRKRTGLKDEMNPKKTQNKTRRSRRFHCSSSLAMATWSWPLTAAALILLQLNTHTALHAVWHNTHTRTYTNYRHRVKQRQCKCMREAGGVHISIKRGVSTRRSGLSWRSEDGETRVGFIVAGLGKQCHSTAVLPSTLTKFLAHLWKYRGKTAKTLLARLFRAETVDKFFTRLGFICTHAYITHRPWPGDGVAFF